MDEPTAFEALLHDTLVDYNVTATVWYVAWSGGADSTALLIALAKLAPKFGASITAIHVNHGLQANADLCAQHCVALADKYNISCVVKCLHMEHTSGTSFETRAREERWNVFAEVMANNAGVLFLAHHAKDKIETHLQRLIRGAGLIALAGMQVISANRGISVCRPLLDIDPLFLRAYLTAIDCVWIEDPSNSDVSIERNYLRHHVLSALISKWPHFVSSANRSLTRLAGDAELLKNYALEHRLSISRLRWGLYSIKRSEFTRLEQQQQSFLLRNWIQSRGWYVIDEPRLNDFLHQCIAAAHDRHPAIITDQYQLIVSGDDIWLLSRADLHAAFSVLWQPGTRQLHFTLAIEKDSKIYTSKYLVSNIAHLLATGLLTRKQLKRYYSELDIRYPLRDCIPCLNDGNTVLSIGDKCLNPSIGFSLSLRLHF